MKLSKKILAAVSIVALAAFAMLPLASCSDDGDSGGQSIETGKDYVLEMAERYEYTYTLVSE